MKRWNAAAAAKNPWIDSFEQGKVFSPQPFPGKYPTRLFWKVGGRTYFGKPTPTKVQEFLHLDKSAKLCGVIMEVDKAHALYSYASGGTLHSNLQRFYHFFQAPPLAGTVDHMLAKLYPKRIGGFTVYSPYATLKKEYVEQFRQYAVQLLTGKLKPPPVVKKKRLANHPPRPAGGNRFIFRQNPWAEPGAIFGVPGEPNPLPPPRPFRRPDELWPELEQVILEEPPEPRR